MKEIKCDILIVGAGAAGSNAARNSALKGANTILIEKNINSVKPACAEALTSSMLSLMPFEIPKNQLKWRIDGIKFYADGLSISKKGKFWEGYSIERSEINPWLTQQAVSSGAKYYNETELIDLEFDNNYQVSSAQVKRRNEEIKIRPKVLIASDGAKSKVAEILRVKQERKCSFAHITSCEMSNLNVENPHMEQIFFDEFSPKGFAYIFPKSDTTANIGVGSVLYPDKTEQLFDDFINFDIVKKQLKNHKIETDRSGYAPVDYSLKKNIYGNVIFSGDAANQNIKPFIEGFVPGIICGDIAGKCATNYLKNNEGLEKYEEIINEKLGDMFQLSDFILNIMMKIFQQGQKKDYLLLLALGAEIVDMEKISDLFNYSYNDLREKLNEIMISKS